MGNDMICIKEVSTKAQLTEPHIRQLLREGKIQGRKIGKEWRVSREELNRYLGIKTDMQSLEKDLYIKDLEGKIRNYEMQMDTFKNLVNTLGNIVGM